MSISGVGALAAASLSEGGGGSVAVESLAAGGALLLEVIGHPLSQGPFPQPDVTTLDGEGSCCICSTVWRRSRTCSSVQFMLPSMTSRKAEMDRSRRSLFRRPR
jgi:hypothetical protein